MMRTLLSILLLFACHTVNAQSSSDSLKTVLNTIIAEYDTLSIANEQIAAEMRSQRAQVDSLRSALERGNYDLEKAQREAQLFRRILNGYIVTINSLNILEKERPRDR